MTTATTSLADFLLQRIADDETWVRSNGDYLDHCQECAFGQQPESPYPQGRVLADCAARRAIVELHGGRLVEAHDGDGMERQSYVCATCWDDEYPCPTLRHLAAPYASHPGFDPAWAVS